MNVYPEMYPVNCNPHDTVQGFTLVPEDKWVPTVYAETHMGPWGWQWKDGVRELATSVSSSSIRITIKSLMDDIEKVGTVERT